MEKVREYIKQNRFELLIFLAFCGLTLLVSCFHEPWYDELQAYAVAKGKISDILYLVPHYEGHPPLWYLILKFFQLFSGNPEIVLRIPNLIIMYTAAWLLVFKSPFPKIIRGLLPFTYFLLYQYSVVCRPYGILFLALFGLAFLYKDRGRHPWIYTAFLALLASASIYGMVLCTTICIEWGISTLVTERISLKNFVMTDKRFLGMLILFFYCLGLSFMVYPADDCLYVEGLRMLEPWQRDLYFLFGVPADATLFNVFNYTSYSSNNIMGGYTFYAFVFGMYLTIELLKFFYKNKKILFFLLSYCALAFAMYKIPHNVHHTGIMFGLFVYMFWCLISENPNLKLSKPLQWILIILIPVQIYWSACAMSNDIQYSYSTSKPVVNFIKEHNLTKYKIMSGSDSNIPNVQWLSVETGAYFGRNIIYNFNIDEPEKLYFLRVKGGAANIDIIYSKWIRAGIPDVYIGKTPHPRNRYIGEIMRIDEMVPAATLRAGFIYKDDISGRTAYVFVRPKIMEEIFGNKN